MKNVQNLIDLAKRMAVILLLFLKEDKRCLNLWTKSMLVWPKYFLWQVGRSD
jgi:hypothetical protein